MTLWITISLIVFIAAIVFFLVKATKGVKRTLLQLEYCIQELLDRGYDGGLLIITHRKSKRFIQFRKYVDSGEVGIELSFPKVQWSEKYFDDVVSYCKDTNIDFEIVKASNEMIFADINVGKKVQEAFLLCKHIFLNIFKVEASDIYFVKLENASSK